MRFLSKIMIFCLLGLIGISAISFFYRDYFFQKKYGMNSNPRRKSLTIPLLEKEFLPNKTGTVWNNSTNSLPQHSMKEIDGNLLNLTFERDHFLYLDKNDTINLYCYYNYDLNCFNFYYSKGDTPAIKINCDVFVENMNKAGLRYRPKCENQCD